MFENHYTNEQRRLLLRHNTQRLTEEYESLIKRAREFHDAMVSLGREGYVNERGHKVLNGCNLHMDTMSEIFVDMARKLSRIASEAKVREINEKYNFHHGMGSFDYDSKKC